MSQHDEFMLCGQPISLVDREVRAPLHILTTVWPSGTGVVVIAHRTRDGKHWFARPFVSLRTARDFFDAIRKQYPYRLSLREWLTRNSGRKERTSWKTQLSKTNS